MIGIIIATHGNLSQGFSSGLEMLFGQAAGFKCLSLFADDSADEFGERLSALITELNCPEGVLILTDIVGGTPSNRALMESAKSPNVSIVTGINMGMLLEVLINRDEMSLPQLTQHAIETGKEGIKQLVLDINTDFGDDLE